MSRLFIITRKETVTYKPTTIVAETEEEALGCYNEQLAFCLVEVKERITTYNHVYTERTPTK